MISWTYRLSVEERMVGNTANNNITKHHNLGKNISNFNIFFSIYEKISLTCVLF